MSDSRSNRKNGEAVASLLSIVLGLAGLISSHWWSVWSPAQANPLLLKLGSWIPGWWGIGPYAGKETAGLALWLGSWIVLHLCLRKRDMSLSRWLYVFSITFIGISTLAWPPIYHTFLGWP